MMVRIRTYQPEDKEAVERIHNHMEMDYKFPDLDSPLFHVKQCLEVDGEIAAACALRIEAETMLWVRPDLDPRSKAVAIWMLQKSILKEAWNAGLTCLVAWIPKTVEKKFRRRLLQLGWQRDREGWHSWSRQITEHDA